MAPLTEMEWMGMNSQAESKESSRLENYLSAHHLIWKEPSDPDSPVEILNFESSAQKSEILSDVTLEIFNHDFLATA